jgi:hypothetical protein
MNQLIDCPVRRTIQKPAQMRRFSSINEFVNNQNNFYLHFFDNFIGDAYRTREVYARFREINPVELRRLQTEVTHSVKEKKPLPVEELFNAYFLMAQLVCENDKYVSTAHGTIDKDYLTR